MNCSSHDSIGGRVGAFSRPSRARLASWLASALSASARARCARSRRWERSMNSGWSSWMLGLGWLAACGDSAFELPPTTMESPVFEVDSGPDRVAPCDEAPDGTPCGSGSDYHCVFSVCLQNVCGDQVVVSGDEECDDGNELDGDGCDARCRREPATSGNGTSLGSAGRAAAGAGGASGRAAAGRGGASGRAAAGRGGASGRATGGRGAAGAAGSGRAGAGGS
jgi:cysteine-rich repeat protein